MNDLSSDIKLLKTQLSKMVKLGWLLDLNPREFVKFMEESGDYVTSYLIRKRYHKTSFKYRF